MSFPPNLRIAQAASLKPLDDIAAEMGIGPHLLEPYGEHVAKIKLDGDRGAGRPAAGQVRRRHRDHPDAARRGQDHHDGRPRPGVLRTSASRPRSRSGSRRWARRSGSRAARPAAATARSCRWSCSTCTSPATSTRSPRRTTCCPRCSTTTSTRATPLGIDLHNITWRRVLDVNDRALRNIVVGLGGKVDGVPRQTGFDITAASRGDGDPRAGHVAAGPARAARPHRRRLHPGRHAGHRRGHRRRRRDGRDHARRDQAEPAADAGEHAGPRARRARSATSRTATRRSSPTCIGIHARRLPRHRGRLRRRHGRRAVLQHQVPGLGAHPGRRGRRRHRAGAQGALRQVQDRRRQAAARGAARGEPRRGPRRRGQPAQADREHPAARRVAGRRDQRLPRPTTRPSTPAIAEIAAEMGARVAVCTHFADGGAGRASWPRPSPRRPRSRRTSGSSTPTRRRCRRRSRRSRPRSTAPTASTTPPAADRQLATYERNGFGNLPVCIAKTHLSISSDPRSRARRPAGGCRCARCGPRSAPGSSTRSAATCARCPGSAPTRPPTTSTSTSDGEIVGLS